jgi:D-threo-aldose 1-dehydrogenase
MFDIQAKTKVGRTEIEVSRLGLGTAQLGFMYEPVSTEEAVDTVQFAYDLGIQFFDTAALYGEGLAEQRLGKLVSKLPRSSFTVATKVGYDMPAVPPETPKGSTARDYSYDGVMRSFENSLKRLGLENVDILHIHDPDDHYQEAMEGAYKAVSELRSQGLIRAVGSGMNQSEMLTRFAHEGDFDCFLLAGRYTLLDQSGLKDLLPVAEEKNISIFIGGPLNSGILADPYSSHAKFNYEDAGAEWIAKAQKIDAVCRRHGVPLKAAALQFPYARQELEENVKMLQVPIPGDLWQELKHEGLLAEDTPTPAPAPAPAE